MKKAMLEKLYRIRHYEVDFKKRALVTSLMNYFDDIAMIHIEELGVGIDYMRQTGKAWVLYQWDIHINEYPTFNEQVIVRTEARAFKKFYACRTFKILNLRGDTLVTANSIWLLSNIKKKKPMKITDDMYEAFGLAKDVVAFPDIKQIPKPDNIHIQKDFYVRYSDIDTNGHVNNVKYAAWSLETVPLEIVKTHMLTGLKVIYKKETLYGKTIKTQTEIKHTDDKTVCAHLITDDEGVELSILESTWEKVSE